MRIENEISYDIERVSETGMDIIDKDTETRRRNMRRLVQGQAGMYPKRNLKAWNAIEIGRGTNVGEKQFVAEEDLIDL